MPTFKKIARGDLVWVLSGRTKHPAKLVLPAEEQDDDGNGEVEIQWLTTGRFEVVSRHRVTADNTTATTSGRHNRLLQHVSTREGCQQSDTHKCQEDDCFSECGMTVFSQLENQTTMTTTTPPHSTIKDNIVTPPSDDDSSDDDVLLSSLRQARKEPMTKNQLLRSSSSSSSSSGHEEEIEVDMEKEDEDDAEENANDSNNNDGAIVNQKAKNSRKKRIPELRLTTKSRVRIKKQRLFHALVQPDQIARMKANCSEFPTNAWIYGDVKSGNKKMGWLVNFEFVGEVLMRSRKAFTVVNRSLEEPRLSAKAILNLAEEDLDASNAQKDTVEVHSEAQFCALPTEEIANATIVSIQISKKKNSAGSGLTEIVWEVLEDGKHIEEDDEFEDLQACAETGPALRPGVDFSEMSLADIFFCYFFPSLDNIGARMNKFFSDPRAQEHLTVKRRGIKFTDDLVRRCILVMIAGANEPYDGSTALWRHGFGDGKEMGRVPYPDFGRYVDWHTFQAFKIAFPRMWADETLWYSEYGFQPWEIAEPFIHAWNTLQRELFADGQLKVRNEGDYFNSLLNTTNYDGLNLLLEVAVVDESISERVPKATKEGGVPNLIYNPRKPKSLGIEFKDSICPIAYIVTYTEIVKNSEQNHAMRFSDDCSLAPGKEKDSVLPATAQTMRQAVGFGLEKGGVIVGDAGFGSVECVLHLHEKLGVHGAFVVKGQTYLYPKQILGAILRARHGDNIGGKWVVMKTKIRQTPIIAVAYAWGFDLSRVSCCASVCCFCIRFDAKLKMGFFLKVSYFVSSIGKTCPSKTPHETAFQNIHGERQRREQPQPEIAAFIYNLLPAIDEWNNKRQGLLRLETKWPTQDTWFRIFTTFIGFSVTNLRNAMDRFAGKSKTILEIANLIAGELNKEPRIQLFPSADLVVTDDNDTPKLVRIRSAGSGATRKRPTKAQLLEGRTKGCAVQRSCFICGIYQRKKQFSSFECAKCGTCLCKIDRSERDPKRRKMSCLQEHLKAKDERVRCDGMIPKRMIPSDARLWKQKDENTHTNNSDN